MILLLIFGAGAVNLYWAFVIKQLVAWFAPVGFWTQLSVTQVAGLMLALALIRYRYRPRNKEYAAGMWVERIMLPTLSLLYGWVFHYIGLWWGW